MGVLELKAWTNKYKVYLRKIYQRIFCSPYISCIFWSFHTKTLNCVEKPKQYCNITKTMGLSVCIEGFKGYKKFVTDLEHDVRSHWWICRSSRSVSKWCVTCLWLGRTKALTQWRRHQWIFPPHARKTCALCKSDFVISLPLPNENDMPSAMWCASCQRSEKCFKHRGRIKKRRHFKKES